MYGALLAAPAEVRDAIEASLPTYTDAVSTEFGIIIPPLERYFDYEPHSMECPDWWFEVGSLDDALDARIASIGSVVTFPVTIAGTCSDGDLDALTHQIRAYGVALVRLLHDLAAINDGSVREPTRAVTGIPSGKDGTWRLGTRVMVRYALIEARA